MRQVTIVIIDKVVCRDRCNDVLNDGTHGNRLIIIYTEICHKVVHTKMVYIKIRVLVLIMIYIAVRDIKRCNKLIDVMKAYYQANKVNPGIKIIVDQEHVFR